MEIAVWPVVLGAFMDEGRRVESYRRQSQWQIDKSQDRDPANACRKSVRCSAFGNRGSGVLHCGDVEDLPVKLASVRDAIGATLFTRLIKLLVSSASSLDRAIWSSTTFMHLFR
jgi:hypothetical protein